MNPRFELHTKPFDLTDLTLVSQRLLGEINLRKDLQAVPDEFGGQVFYYDDPSDFRDSPGMQTILSRGGILFLERPSSEGTKLQALSPDPERLLVCSQAYDIPIKFVPDVNSPGPLAKPQDIPGKIFTKVVKVDRCHPVGVNNIIYYDHDICSFDHFPAVIVGRKPLIDWLVVNTPADKDLGDVYDSATMYITNVIRRLTGQLPNQEDAVSKDIKAVVNLLKDMNDSLVKTTNRDIARNYELRNIIYDGLQNCGITCPEIMPGRLHRIGGAVLSRIHQK
ncbi:MAG TPA: hypothetical protein VFB59_03850 [Candidatus Saccharimonadales bacterium]|nr:hypothetical protein [Candidatus Saccharimonadales bacterium]